MTEITIQKLVLEKKGAFDPQAPALECGGQRFTYGEFDRLTDRIAANLRKKQCGPGSPVIVRMGRTAEMVLSMYGVFKAGAAFVPVMPIIPKARFELIKKSVKAAWIIDADSYGELAGEPETDAAAEPETEAVSFANGTDPAMILYTSGSTGEPKGVVQNQHSVGFLFDQFPYKLEETGAELGEFDSILARLNNGFAGAYHYEYGAALLNGKRLVLLEEGKTGSIEETSRILEDGGTFCVTFIPSQLTFFLENKRFCRSLSAVSCLCFLAEPVSAPLQEQLEHMENFHGSMVDLYGQTECYGITWQDLRHGGKSMPSPCVRICTADEDGRLVGPGEKGELVVSSPTMFDRYLLSDAEEAARIFAGKNLVADGQRFVRTGDVGVVNEDGSIRLCGRNDRMVKYHGQRIELPEIEKAMKAVSGIRNCCALIAHSENGSELLCAYYEGENGQDADVDALCRHLRSSLPPYMIPVYYKRLDRMPVNANGKTDYKALAAIPVELKREPRGASRALSQKEQLIADAAAGLLQISADSIGAESNLMVLGVDSLNAVLLISDLAEAGYSLSLEGFVNAASVEELALKLRARDKAKVGTAPKVQKEVSNLVRCSDMQTRWIQAPIQIVSGMMAFRGIEKEELGRKMQELEHCHPALRSSFIEDQGKWYTKALKTRPIRWEYTDLRKIGDGSGNLTERQKRFAAMKFNLLQSKPDMRDLIFVSAVRTADDRTVLLLRVDHRIMDGMSEKLIWDELLMEAPVEKPDNYISYLDSTGEEAVRQQAQEFWGKYLDGAAIPCVPLNKNRSGRPRYRQFHVVIDGEQEQKIRERCHLQGVSVSAYILCRYGRAIMDVLELPEAILNVAVSGRSMDVENMNRVVGCIVNTAPIRIHKTDTEKDFMNSYLQVDRYSFLNAGDIYRAAFGLETEPELLPFVVSEIFPDTLIREPHEMLFRVPFGMFRRGDFLWEDEKGLHLMLHPDVDHWEEETIVRIVRRTEELLRM